MSIKWGLTVEENPGNEVDATTAATDIGTAIITATANAYRTALLKTMQGLEKPMIISAHKIICYGEK